MNNQNIETQPELIYLIRKTNDRQQRRAAEMEFNRIAEELNGLMNLEIAFCDEVLNLENERTYVELYADLKKFSSEIFAVLENKKLKWYCINRTYFVQKYKVVESMP